MVKNRPAYVSYYRVRPEKNVLRGGCWLSLVVFMLQALSACQTAPPEFRPPMWDFADSAKVSMTCEDDGARIHYTTDGSDPRQPVTGAISANAQRYVGPVTLTTTTRIQARTLREDPSAGPVWSARNDALVGVDDGTNDAHQP